MPALLNEIRDRIAEIEDQAIVVGSVVSAAVAKISRTKHTAENRRISVFYTGLVRNHLHLFNLIYNEEAQMITRLIKKNHHRP